MKKLSLLILTSLVFFGFCFLYFQPAKAQNSTTEPTSETSPLPSSDLNESFSRLINIAQEKESVPVIVGFRSDFTPEGYLTDQFKGNQRTQIKQNQDALLQKLESFKPENIKQFETIPYFAMTVDAKTLEFLKNQPEIIFIREDELHAPTLFESTQIVRAPQAWNAGFSGQGQVIAILDTGIDKNHPFLSGKVISEACYSTNSASQGYSSVCPGGVSQSTATNSGLNCNTSISGCSHGTHVAGIAAGRLTSSSFYGVARDANLVAIQVFSRVDNDVMCKNGQSSCVLTLTSDYIKGLERVFTLKQSGMNIASANMSLGSSGDDGAYTSNCNMQFSPTKAAIDNLRSVGVATVVSSGNGNVSGNGYTNAISSPACISSAVSVGSTGDGSSGATVDVVSSFSNSSSFLSLLAPGQWIQSSVPNGGYENMPGTSQAAPHVAGAWAILKQRVPNASVTDILNALSSTGLSITDSRNGIVKPRIRVDAALQALGGGGTCPTTPISSGQTVNGSLATTDCTLSGRGYVDTYTFNGTAGQRITVSMNSPTFDTYLYLINPSSQTLDENDDSGGGTNSRIPITSGFLTLPTTGTYSIYATSFDGNRTGAYSISLTSESSGQCSTTSINFGQTINGSLQSGDCIYTDGSNYDAYIFTGTAGQQVYMTLNSVQFDAYLLLYQGSFPGGSLLTQDNNGGGGTNARIPATSGFFTLPVTGTYTILANSFAAGESGAYTLALTQNCSYSLNQISQSFSAAGGTGTVNVITGTDCAWSSLSNVPWITTFTNGNGMGNGTVTFSVAANTGSNRSGTITIAGQTFTVNQTGASTSRRTGFDFDGDGKADVSVFRPSNGIWYLLNSQSGFGGVQFGAASDKIVPADYDGDGRTDVAVFRNDTWFLQRSGLGFTNLQFGQSGDVPVPGDYDGDGKADIAVYRPSSGTWFLQRSNLGFTGIQFGSTGDVPIAADFDGDGKADLAVFRPSNGIWYLQQSTLGFIGVQFGAVGDRLVPADYDGDGKTDLAVYRPSNSFWYLNRSQAGFTGIQFGISTDVPTPADYDGDGKTDIAVYRNDTWFIQRSTAGFTGVQFGGAEDKPVPNAFVP